MQTRFAKPLVTGVLGLLLGCAHSGTIPPTEPSRGQAESTQANRFALEVSVPSSDGGGSSLLASGSTLRSGDRYSLKVTVTQPLYVYVEQHGATGPSFRFPSPEQPAPQQTPQAALLLPVDGFFRLDAKAGTESIYVVAARAPLSAQQLATEIGRLAAQQAREVAEPSNSRNRGELVWGGLDEHGIGGVSFRIRHE